VHPPLRADQRGITALAFAQPLDVVGDLAVEKLDAVRAHKAEAATAAQVQYADAGVQRGQLIRRVAVVRDDFRVADGRERSAESVVQFVQGQNSHLRKLARFANKRKRRISRMVATYERLLGHLEFKKRH